MSLDNDVWSSTSYFDNLDTYRQAFGKNTISTSGNNGRYNAFSVRCLVL